MSDIKAIQKVNIECIRGNDKNITVTVSNNGSAMNITGATFTMKIKKTGDTFLTLTPTIIDPATNGQILVTITQANRTELEALAGGLPYYIDITESNEKLKTIMRGSFIIIEKI